MSLLPGEPISVTLEEPVNPGLVITDGAPPDPLFCAESKSQRVGEFVPLQPIRVPQLLT